MANKTFNNIQVFFDFLHDVENGAWGETKQPPEVLFSNLDKTGHTNMAVELAKIYSWAQKVFEFEPYEQLTEEPVDFDPRNYYKIVDGEYVKGSVGDTYASTTWYALSDTPVTIDTDVIPGFHTYDFREGSTDGAFELSIDGEAYAPVAIHNVAMLGPDGKVLPIELPSFVDDVLDGYYEQELLTTQPTSFDPTKYYKIVSGEYVKGSVGDAWAADTWYTPKFVHYDLLDTQPTSFDPTKYYKIVDGAYVKGTVGDPWAADTWYERVDYEGESGKIYVDLATDHSWRCIPEDTTTHTPEVWVDISNPISMAELCQLMGLNVTTNGDFDATHHGFVPQPGAGDTGKFLSTTGWEDIPDSVSITPVTNPQQTKIADVEIGSTEKDLYVPNFVGVQYTLVTTQPGTFNPTDYFKLDNGVYVQGVAGETWAANTWYTASVASKQNGIVTAPTNVNQGMNYLRGDGTWGSPADDLGILILNCNHNTAYDPT